MFGNLLGHGLGAVVQFGEAVFVRNGVVANPFSQVASEGLCYGEDDASAADGVSFYVVKLSVAVQVVVGVQTVQLHGTQQGSVLQLFFGDVGEIYT